MSDEHVLQPGDRVRYSDASLEMVGVDRTHTWGQMVGTFKEVHLNGVAALVWWDGQRKPTYSLLEDLERAPDGE